MQTLRPFSYLTLDILAADIRYPLSGPTLALILCGVGVATAASFAYAASYEVHVGCREHEKEMIRCRSCTVHIGQ